MIVWYTPSYVFTTTKQQLNSMIDFSPVAKRVLQKYFQVEDELKPLYIQPDRQVFLAVKLQVVLKLYENESTLKKSFRPHKRQQTLEYQQQV